MTAAHAKTWRNNKQKQEEAIVNKALQNEFERRFHQQVIIYAWTQVNFNYIQVFKLIDFNTEFICKETMILGIRRVLE